MQPFAFRAFPSDELLRHVFEQSSVGIFQSTLEGRNLLANPALARILGYDSPEELRESIRSVERDFYADPGRRREVNELLARQGGRIEGVESRVRRRDGSIIWVSESTRIVVDVETDQPVYLGSISDVTARKEAELALVEREERLRREVARRRAAEAALGVDMEEALLACGADGAIEFCSERAARLLSSHFPDGCTTSLPEAVFSRVVGAWSETGAVEFVLTTATGKLQIHLTRGQTAGDIRILRLSEPVRDLLRRALGRQGLTPREADVLHWLMGGKANAQIASILGVAEKTVKKHLERVYDKLGVENRTAAVLLASEQMARFRGPTGRELARSREGAKE